ncbi:hypothetical protein PR202_ga15327 [Eleusine coracana subsp. coracana]|uniref:Pollen Ole e 1 allergen and extensin family protein n=1 Tax=Eleusine coracana subsp. coracana TaxID=191504 RepID=A0AAV5CK38_ELECO|nr:hypothetical protein QOZ80_6BG0494320 [Eleusine coracana subsp. coracana]GJM98331.1 hypothetical protein PR202_ga15327 [Eleusine coracana subsp. coracana]
MAAMASSKTAAPIAVFLGLMLLMLGGTEAKFKSNNITVVGSVYCDACSNNTFSKHSFFLKGARVLIQCNFKVNSTTSEELSLEAERTTDQNGVYKLDVPPVDGFACREGHELRSACRATLVRSSSAACNVPGQKGSSSSSTQHIALRSRATNACFLNLNALNFRPAKRDAALCRAGDDAFGSSLFFWPFLPLFWPPFRWLPLPAPGGTVSFPWPFPVPEWLVPFLRPPFLPFPLYEPASPPPPPPFFRFPPAQEKAASQP